MIEVSTLLPAGEVEKRTSLSADLLVLWERQFGFPTSHPDANGNLFYDEGELPRLRLIGFLAHAGERAARLMTMSDAALAYKAGDLRSAIEIEAASVDADAVRDCLRMIGDNDCGDLEARMRSHIISHGLSAFVVRVAAPLCHAVGTGWETGRFSVFQEHIFAELLERTLTVAGASLFQPDALRFGRPKPAVLLATPPGEDHRLGLAMAEAMLRLEGCHCVRVGTHTPVSGIVAAARAHRCDIVAVSFSSCYSPARTIETICTVRAGLDAEGEVWAGGTNAGLRHALPEGVRTFSSLEPIPAAVAEWRKARFRSPAESRATFDS